MVQVEDTAAVKEFDEIDRVAKVGAIGIRRGSFSAVDD
jgi:hypothetical protein